MRDSSSLNAGSSTTSLNCSARYCNYRGRSLEDLWDHLQDDHGVEAIEGSSGSFRVQWRNSGTSNVHGARVVGLLTYLGRRLQVWFLDEPDEVHVLVREVRNSAPSASLPLSLELSSGQSGIASMVTVEKYCLTVSRQTLLDNLCQKRNGKVEAWISIHIDHNHLLAGRTATTCQVKGIAEMSAPKWDNSVVLHSSTPVSAKASFGYLAFSPISHAADPETFDVTTETSLGGLLDVSPPLLLEETASMVMRDGTSGGGLFDVSQPLLLDQTAGEEATQTFIEWKSC